MRSELRGVLRESPWPSVVLAASSASPDRQRASASRPSVDGVACLRRRRRDRGSRRRASDRRPASDERADAPRARAARRGRAVSPSSASRLMSASRAIGGVPQALGGIGEDTRTPRDRPATSRRLRAGCARPRAGRPKVERAAVERQPFAPPGGAAQRLFEDVLARAAPIGGRASAPRAPGRRARRASCTCDVVRRVDGDTSESVASAVSNWPRRASAAIAIAICRSSLRSSAARACSCGHLVSEPACDRIEIRQFFARRRE